MMRTADYRARMHAGYGPSSCTAVRGSRSPSSRALWAPGGDSGEAALDSVLRMRQRRRSSSVNGVCDAVACNLMGGRGLFDRICAWSGPRKN